jgi:hypothetical protein
MKKLRQRVSPRGPIPIGYAIYKWESLRFAYGVCLWWTYPIFRIPVLLIELKHKLFRYLNKIGIMHTGEGQMMSIRDISFRKFYEKRKKSDRQEDIW